MNDQQFDTSHSKVGSRIMVGMVIILLIVTGIVIYAVLGT